MPAKLPGQADQPWQSFAEDCRTKRERFGEGGGGAGARLPVPPGCDVIFRPEEVERVSEPLARFRAQHVAAPDPRHDVEVVARSVGVDGHRERLAAMVTVSA